MRIPSLPAVLGAVAVISGCATYIPPSGRADFTAFKSASMQESFAARPAAGFPAGIAAVRVQASRYRNYFTEREGGVYGEGRYSVITVKEVEEDADFERLAKLPQVGGLISISTLLLPSTLQSDRELREAAARLKADMLLLYTFETSFYQSDASVALSALTLGLSPTRKVFVNVTASALLMDTRTGFIYAAFEANEKRRFIPIAWDTGEKLDRARRDAERAAFTKLIGEFEKSWPAIVERAHKGV
jgi:hypothetical protein